MVTVIEKVVTNIETVVIVTDTVVTFTETVVTVITVIERQVVKLSNVGQLSADTCCYGLHCCQGRGETTGKLTGEYSRLELQLLQLREKQEPCCC